MSALQQTEHDVERTGSSRLRVVPRPRVNRVGRVPFLILVASILAVGMVGLLLLNTTLQNQAFEANRLKRHAADLAYTEGELQQNVIEASSARELNRRATAIGLRPNHGIAYVSLVDGKVSGKPQAQDPYYLPEALTLSPEEIAANNRAEAVNAAEHRENAEVKAAADARQRILDARAKAEADAKAKAEADAKAKAEADAKAKAEAEARKNPGSNTNAQPANPNGAR